MTNDAVESQSAAVDALTRAIAGIEQSEFTAYPGGWPNDAGLALVDAVFSMRARYYSTTPGAGVYQRLRHFETEHPAAVDDLRALADVGAPELRRIMGNAETAQRPKADCVNDAAHALLALDPPAVTAVDVRTRDAKEIDRAYTSVRGLGGVTAEYFRMLVGVQGVKSDVMVMRFVNAALVAAGLRPVSDPCAVRSLVVAAHASDGRGVGLTAYEHALWRTKGHLPTTV